MIFKVSTVKFRGQGQIDCRLCNHGVVFPLDAQVIIYTWLGQTQIISATDLSTHHRCGTAFHWWCDTCEAERPPPTARRYRHTRMWQGAKACPVCGGEIRQRTVHPQVCGHPVEG